MKANILNGISSEEDKDELRGLFSSSLRLRRRLQSLMQDKINSHFTHMMRPQNYAESGWAESQADSIGYIRGLTEAISLLDDEKGWYKRGRGRPINYDMDFSNIKEKLNSGQID